MILDESHVRELEVAREHLLSHRNSFEAGLTDSEFQAIEERFGFQFPFDVRWFLMQGLPSGDRFPNWRTPDQKLINQLEWPAEGILFDVRNSVFWYPAWGERPASTEEAVVVADGHLRVLPQVIPIFGHSYLPSVPCLPGNPVFSIYQSDVIHRGGRLSAYLHWIDNDGSDEAEENYPVYCEDYRQIPFWTEMARMNYY